jgi:hypothetical protein
LAVSLPPLAFSRQSQDLGYPPPPDPSDEEDNEEVDDHQLHHQNGYYDTESNDDDDWSREDGGSSWSEPRDDTRSVQSYVHAHDDMATEEAVEVSTCQASVDKPSIWSMFSAWLLGTSLARMFQDHGQSSKHRGGAMTTKQRGRSDHSSLDITHESSLEEDFGEKIRDNDKRTRDKGGFFAFCYKRGGGGCCNPYVAAATFCCLIVAIVLIVVLGRGLRKNKTASVDFQSSQEQGDSTSTGSPAASPMTAEPLSPTSSSSSIFPVSFPPTASPVVGSEATAPPTSSPTANALVVEQPTYQTNTSNFEYYSSQIRVGAYYYPWHGSNFHNFGGYVRSQLVPQQLPALGEYDDTDPETIRQHLAWSQQANIGLWVT